VKEQVLNWMNKLAEVEFEPINEEDKMFVFRLFGSYFLNIREHACPTYA
jgi:hypothetical protein